MRVGSGGMQKRGSGSTGFIKVVLVKPFRTTFALLMIWVLRVGIRVIGVSRGRKRVVRRAVRV